MDYASTSAPGATAGAAPAAAAEAPPHVRAFDEATVGLLQRWTVQGGAIGGDAEKATKDAVAIFGALRAFLLTAACRAKPSAAELPALLAPLSQKIDALSTWHKTLCNSVHFNHVSAVAEGIPAVGFVSVELWPARFVMGKLNSSMCYVNRVLKDNKEHAEWMNTWRALLEALQTFVRITHTTGVVWNSVAGAAPPGAAATAADRGGFKLVYPPGLRQTEKLCYIKYVAVLHVATVEARLTLLHTNNRRLLLSSIAAVDDSTRLERAEKQAIELIDKMRVSDRVRKTSSTLHMTRLLNQRLAQNRANDMGGERAQRKVTVSMQKLEKPALKAGSHARDCVPGGWKAAAATPWDDSEGNCRVRVGEVLGGRYRVFGHTGAGMFGNVVRCTDLERNNTVAVKIIRNDEIVEETGVRELQVLRKLNEADKEDTMHCLQLYRTFNHHNSLCLVFENLSMNLRELLKKCGNKVGLHLNAVQKYARQLLLALRLLKKCYIVHADIKPDNILVDESASMLKLCDFGSSGAIYEQEIAPYLMSRFYRAPEIILGVMPYDYGIDMWSLAVTLYELYTGNIMFPGKSNNHMLKLFTEVTGAFPKKLIHKAAFKTQHFDDNCNFLYKETDKVTQREKISVLENIRPTRNLDDELKGSQQLDKESIALLREFRNLLEQMLALDPANRITVGDALEHPFIVGL